MLATTPKDLRARRGLAAGLPLLNNKTLIDLRFFTQYACIDERANSFGLTSLNGVETWPGGWKK